LSSEDPLPCGSPTQKTAAVILVCRGYFDDCSEEDGVGVVVGMGVEDPPPEELDDELPLELEDGEEIRYRYEYRDGKLRVRIKSEDGETDLELDEHSDATRFKFEVRGEEIDVDLVDGYWNDGYDGYNAMDDDSDNLDNTQQASELNFSSGVQSITANDILTRHGENVFVSVRTNVPIESGDSCSFDASPWGASASTSVGQSTAFLYQGPFTTNLGSTRNDDQARAIGRASVFHETGGNATVTDSATNSDSKANFFSISFTNCIYNICIKQTAFHQINFSIF